MTRPAAQAAAIAAAMLCALVLGAGPADACSCADLPSPCTPDGDIVIFTGRVMSSAPFMSSMTRYELRVRETFRGHPGENRVSVTSQASIDTCGFPFEPGEDYLVFAWKGDDGALFTGLCTLTRRVDADGDYLPLLREMKQGTPRSRLIGSVAEIVRRLDGQYQNVDYVPVAGVRVTASDGAGRFSTSTDRNGGFRFVGLPAGNYAVTPDLDSRFDLVGGPGRRVMFDSCFANVGLSVVRTPLDGVVLDAAGRPLTEVVHVGVVPAGTRGGPPPRGASTYVLSGPDGTWRFEGLPPGRYYVGTNLFESPDDTPYQPYWHAAAGRPAEPAVVAISHDRPVHLELRVGPRFERTSLRGLVVDDAGAPVVHASVILTDADSGRDYLFAAFVGDDGRFSVPAFKGRSYRIAAIASADTASADAAPANTAPANTAPQNVTDDHGEIRIVIPRPRGR